MGKYHAGRSEATTPLSRGEIYDLAQKLDKVTMDLVERLKILATDPWVRNGISGPHVQSQPSSRPPYNLAAGVILSQLCNEIATTVRHLCEHRGIDTPERASSITGAAQWLRRNVNAIGVMADGREMYTSLCRVIDDAVRSVGFEDQEYRIPKDREESMTREANRIAVTSNRAERLARQLGDQAKGLTRKRVDYLREQGYLTGEWDDESKCWTYLLGDVLAAHKRLTEDRRMTHGRKRKALRT